jgi:hypothetical protein
MLEAFQEFDTFVLRTRVQPALLASLSAVATILLLWPSSPLLRVVPAVGAVGVLYLAAELTRSGGKRVEARLKERWDGLPAQAALRLAGSTDPNVTARRRQIVEGLLGRPLPSRQQETGHKHKADRAYDAAIRELIPRVRGADKDPLLHSENITYNFRRNALGCRPLALACAAATGAADIAAIVLDHHRGTAIIALAVTALCAGVWTLAVTDQWVREAADVYATRLYEAFDALARG